MSEMNSAMMRLFQAGAQTYQPEGDGLARETGDPQVSLENVRLMLAAGHRIREMVVKPTGVLVRFDGDCHFYATGFRVGSDGPATEALARIAAEAGFGPYDELLSFYQNLPDSYDSVLPDMKADTLPPSIRARLGI